MIRFIFIFILKEILSILIFYIFLLVLWYYIKEYFFLKDRNEVFSRKRLLGDYLRFREK